MLRTIGVAGIGLIISPIFGLMIAIFSVMLLIFGSLNIFGVLVYRLSIVFWKTACIRLGYGFRA